MYLRVFSKDGNQQDACYKKQVHAYFYTGFEEGDFITLTMKCNGECENSALNTRIRVTGIEEGKVKAFFKKGEGREWPDPVWVDELLHNIIADYCGH